MNNNDIEKEVKTKGLNKGPRLTLEQIKSVVLREQYHVFPGTTLTVCALTLKNGYTVTGEAASVSAENFNAELGRKIAKDNALDKVWQLEGYLLKEVVFEKQLLDSIFGQVFATGFRL